MAGGERRVAAQLDLARRREPAQIPIGLAAVARAPRRRSRRDCSRPRSPAASRRAASASSGITAAGLPVNGARRRRRPGRTEAGHSSIRSVMSAAAAGCRGRRLAFGIDVDQDLGAREIRAASSLLDRVDHVVRLRDGPSAGTQTWNWTKSCVAAGAGAQVVKPLQLGMARGDGEEALRASPRAIPCPSAGRSPRLDARHAPHASHSAMREAEQRVGPGDAEIVVEHQRGDHRALSSRSDL